MLEKDKGLKLARKVFDMPEGAVQKGVGDDGEVKTKGKRGRKKRVSGDMEGASMVDDSPKKGKKMRRKSDVKSELMSGGIGEEDLDMEDDLED
jgi:hypothetical protein